MHSFDCGGKTWRLAVNITTVKRVRQLASFDLLDLKGGACILRLLADPVLLVDVLFALCKPQADAEGVTDEAFGQSMTSDCLTLAMKALCNELVDFQPSRDRENLRKALDMLDKALEAARVATAAKLAGVKVHELVAEAMAEAKSAEE